MEKRCLCGTILLYLQLQIKNLSIMKEFKIRAYDRMELAQLYSPELTDIAAYRKNEKMALFLSGTSATLI